MQYKKAIDEAPYLRDAYVELALLYYELNYYNNVIKYCNEALLINEHTKSYINEQFSFDGTIYDLLSIAYYYTGKVDKAFQNVLEALKYQPNNDRIKENKKIIEKEL